MLHVRLVVPSSLRTEVLAKLVGEDTVCNLSVTTDGAVQPAGDLVVFDVPLEVANTLLHDFKACALDEHGSIALHRVDTTLSRRASLAERLAEGTPSEAVIWEEVAARVGAEARYTPSFAVFMVVAVLIAAIAVLTDSPVLVIGAMVVGPEFGPLAAAMLSLHRRRWADACRATATLVGGFALAAAITVVFTLALRVVDRVPSVYDAGAVQFTRFISHPDLFSVLVALLAGVAGVLSLTEGRSGTLVGVLISVTTIPALANAAVALALGHHHEALGALAQLAVNLGCLLGIGLVTLAVQERLLRRHGRRLPLALPLRR